jgi:hypothetical protein
MSDSPQSEEQLARVRARKRDWARKKSEERKAKGEVSYTSEWRRANTELYEAQKKRARDRRASRSS